MKDEDLYGPKLSPPPPTSPIVRGAAVVLVTVALASAGCNPSSPGVPAVVDAGIWAPSDANPGVADAGVAPDMGLHPGVPAVDAGIDADNPGDHT